MVLLFGKGALLLWPKAVFPFEGRSWIVDILGAFRNTDAAAAVDDPLGSFRIVFEVLATEVAAAVDDMLDPEASAVVRSASGLICIMLWALRSGEAKGTVTLRFSGMYNPEYFTGRVRFASNGFFSLCSCDGLGVSCCCCCC